MTPPPTVRPLLPPLTKKLLQTSNTPHRPGPRRPHTPPTTSTHYYRSKILIDLQYVSKPPPPTPSPASITNIPTLMQPEYYLFFTRFDTYLYPSILDKSGYHPKRSLSALHITYILLKYHIARRRH